MQQISSPLKMKHNQKLKAIIFAAFLKYHSFLIAEIILYCFSKLCPALPAAHVAFLCRREFIDTYTNY